MILYLDTSALVKLYVEEKHSDLVRVWAERVNVVATNEVAYAEMASALNRAFREGRISQKGFQSVWHIFDEDWECYTVVEAGGEVLSLAKELIFRHGLRGFDGIHLASALILEVEGEVVFGAFDQKLLKAAEREGLRWINYERLSSS